MMSSGNVRFLVVLGIIVVGLTLFAQTTLGKVAIGIIVLFAAIAFAAVYTPGEWTDTDAKVVGANIHTGTPYGKYGSLTLSYPDGSGAEHRETFRINSVNLSAVKIEQGETISVRVCKLDPTVISSPWFTVSDGRKCAAPTAAATEEADEELPDSNDFYGD